MVESNITKAKWLNIINTYFTGYYADATAGEISISQMSIYAKF